MLDRLPSELLERIGSGLPPTEHRALQSTSAGLRAVLGYENVPYWVGRIRKEPYQLIEVLGAVPELYMDRLRELLSPLSMHTIQTVFAGLLMHPNGAVGTAAVLASVLVADPTSDLLLATVNSFYRNDAAFCTGLERLFVGMSDPERMALFAPIPAWLFRRCTPEFQAQVQLLQTGTPAS